MSDQDYKAGLRGSTFAPGSMNYADWYAGNAQFEVQRGPKTEIDGVGFTGLVLAHILAIMYPVAGAIVVAGAGAAFLIARAVTPQFGVALTAAAVVGLAILHFGVKAEHALSRSRLYRVLRQVFRLGLFATVSAAYLFPDWFGLATPSSAPAPSGGLIFAAILILVGLHFLFRAFDRKLFPVRDSKVIAQEKKYAELTDEEVFAIKNAKFRGILWFAATWLVSAVALMFVFREGVPVALLVAGPFVVLWLLRKRLFFKVHRRRLAEAEALRAQRGNTFEEGSASAPAETNPAA